MHLLTEAIYNSCNFILKKNNNTPFLSLKPIKEPQTSFWRKQKNSRGRHCCQIFKTKCSNRNISTSLAPLGANWVSKEPENFKELEFFGLVRCFSVKIAQFSKNRPKMAFFSGFWFNFGCFWRFFQFWLKNSGLNLEIWVPWSFMLLLTPTLTPRARY